MGTLRLGLDLDGCVYDFVTAAREVLREMGYPDPGPATHWDWVQDALGEEVWKKLWSEGLASHNLFRKPHCIYPGAVAMMALLQQVFDVVVVTSRPENARVHTEWLLRELGMRSDAVIYALLDAKHEAGCDVYVEDAPDAVAELEARGIPVVVVARPWNEGVGKIRAQDLSHVRYLAALVTNKEEPVEAVYVDSPSRDGSMFVTTPGAQYPPNPPFRSFDTGATRDSEDGKHDPEGFLSPLVLAEFCRYMHSHRVQNDGSLRGSDNWQRGMPLDAYMKSLLRHVFDLWLLHRGYSAARPETEDRATVDDTLGGIFFNAQGYWLETLRGRA